MPFNVDSGEINVTRWRFLNHVCSLFVYNNTTRFCVLHLWFGSQHFFNWYWPWGLKPRGSDKQSMRREMRCGLSFQIIVRSTVSLFCFSLFILREGGGVKSSTSYLFNCEGVQLCNMYLLFLRIKDVFKKNFFLWKMDCYWNNFLRILFALSIRHVVRIILLLFLKY